MYPGRQIMMKNFEYCAMKTANCSIEEDDDVDIPEEHLEKMISVDLTGVNHYVKRDLTK